MSAKASPKRVDPAEKAKIRHGQGKHLIGALMGGREVTGDDVQKLALLAVEGSDDRM